VALFFLARLVTVQQVPNGAVAFVGAVLVCDGAFQGGVEANLDCHLYSPGEMGIGVSLCPQPDRGL
jgi:hypothetical protein